MPSFSLLAWGGKTSAKKNESPVASAMSRHFFFSGAGQQIHRSLLYYQDLPGWVWKQALIRFVHVLSSEWLAQRYLGAHHSPWNTGVKTCLIDGYVAEGSSNGNSGVGWNAAETPPGAVALDKQNRCMRCIVSSRYIYRKDGSLSARDAHRQITRTLVSTLSNVACANTKATWKSILLNSTISQALC